MSKVKLIWVTPDAEKHIMYCARVSNPKNQDSGNTGLLQYCMNHGHWSIFEMAHMCVEITTTRAIAAQILRHRSFSFQEFSQRYAECTELVPTTPRRQDNKNRQNSIDDLNADTLTWWDCAEYDVHKTSMRLYKEALDKGIAKECARMLLPMAAKTKLYMVGSMRSWLTYCYTRCHPSTQKEHRDIALQCRDLLEQQIPNVPRIIDINISTESINKLLNGE